MLAIIEAIYECSLTLIFFQLMPTLEFGGEWTWIWNWAILSKLCLITSLNFFIRGYLLHTEKNINFWEALNPTTRPELFWPNIYKKTYAFLELKPINLFNEQILINENLWTNHLSEFIELTI